jgi:acetyl esterase
VAEVRIDPRARMFLAALDAMGWPRMHERTPAEARRDYRLLANLTSGWQPVARVRDAIAHDADRRVRVRVYTPRRGGAPRPLLVYFHGGGFVVGDLETVDGLCRGLANEAGAVVVSVDYRRAPEHPVPAAQDDALAATRWALRQARRLGADPARVAVGGDSAGGTLAAVVAQQLRADGPSPIGLQVLLYPATDFTFAQTERDPLLARLPTWETIDWFGRHSMPDADRRDPRVSPAFTENLADLPRALIVTAAVDSFAGDARRYAERLRAAGVDVTVADFDGQLHGFVTMDLVFPAARRARRLVARTVAGMEPVRARPLTAAPEPIEWSGHRTALGPTAAQLWARNPARLLAQWSATLAQHRLRTAWRRLA